MTGRYLIYTPTESLADELRLWQSGLLRMAVADSSLIRSGRTGLAFQGGGRDGTVCRCALH
jgi:hypothetical protein